MNQQKISPQNAEISGYIIVTTGAALLFTTNPRPGQTLISPRVDLLQFLNFTEFLKSGNLLDGVMLRESEITISEAYQEFILNSMLYGYGITKFPNEAPEAPKSAAINGKFSFLFENTRQWLRKKLRRVF